MQNTTTLEKLQKPKEKLRAIRVGEIIFPVDFYVLDMGEGFSHGLVTIILGRPFMKTARTKIDVYAWLYNL